MKLTILTACILVAIIVALSVSSCATATTTNPDGTQTTVTTIDPAALAAGIQALDNYQRRKELEILHEK